MNKLLDVINSKSYDFLREDDRIKDRIILLTLAGSRGIGTCTESSDYDFRGIAYNTEDYLLGGKEDFNEIVETGTDTTVYSVDKVLTKFTDCNPQMLDILGAPEDGRVICNEDGKMILDNRKAFFSKKVIYSYAAYANKMIKRLEVAIMANQGKLVDDPLEVLKATINRQIIALESLYSEYGDFSIDFKDSDSTDHAELYVNANLKNVPMLNYADISRKVSDTYKDFKNGYTKEKSERYKSLKEVHRLGKHSMHLVNLYITGTSLLATGDFCMRREGEELELLKRIKAGEFLTPDKMGLTSAFYDILNEKVKAFEYAKKHNVLPDKADFKKIDEMRYILNRHAIENSWNLRDRLRALGNN